MNTRRCIVAILFVLFALTSWTQGMGPDAKQFSEMSVWQAKPPGQAVNRVSAQSEYAIGTTLLKPWDVGEKVHICDQPTLSPNQQQCSASESEFADWQDCGPSECFGSNCNAPCPSLYGQVGAIFWNRQPRYENRPIAVDPNTGTTFLSTSDLNSNFEPGLMAAVGMRLRGNRMLEFSSFNIFEANTTAVAVAPNPAAFLIFPNNLAGNVFVDMDRTQVNYSYLLQSYAVNLACCCGCCCDTCCSDQGFGNSRCQSVTWFGGFRYLNLNEQLNISAQRTVAGALEEGAYNVRTANHLYGGQLGASFRRSQGRFGWDATGFGGIFSNQARQTQSVTDFPNFPLRPPVSTSAAGLAFVGGINLSGLYALTDVWNLRAGYNVLWIEGLALAPDQLDFNFAAAAGGNQLNNSGGMFLHGFNVGLEARW